MAAGILPAVVYPASEVGSQWPVSKESLLSLRVDADVIDWFKSQGAGYQSRMNALLRAYMEAHK